MSCPHNGLDFCVECKPKYNSVTIRDDCAIFLGRNNFLSVLSQWLSNKTVVRWWVGTDVLLMHSFPPGRGRLSICLHRLQANLIGRFVALELANGFHLAEELSRIGINAIDKRWFGNLEKWGKLEHDKFTIAYYHPRDDIFSRWVYGIDIVERLKEIFINVRWVELDGKREMGTVMADVDLYLRPNRHDGFSHTIQECEYNDVPFVWTFEEKPIIFFKRIIDAYIHAKGKHEK